MGVCMLGSRFVRMLGGPMSCVAGQLPAPVPGCGVRAVHPDWSRAVSASSRPLSKARAWLGAPLVILCLNLQTSAGVLAAQPERFETGLRQGRRSTVEGPE